MARALRWPEIFRLALRLQQPYCRSWTDYWGQPTNNLEPIEPQEWRYNDENPIAGKTLSGMVNLISVRSLLCLNWLRRAAGTGTTGVGLRRSQPHVGRKTAAS